MANEPLGKIAADLYGQLPADFIKARNESAKRLKAEGDAPLAQAVQKLKKPTVGAWLLNTLVRDFRDEIDQVLSLGVELRAAQADLASDQWRALDKRRRQLVAGLVTQARAVGREHGHKVTDQVAQGVENTLRAALTEESAAEAVRSGVLLDTFTASGLGPVDLDGLLAIPDAIGPPTKSRPAGPRLSLVPTRDLAAAKAVLERATAALVEARQHRKSAADQAQLAQEAKASAAAALSRLRAELSEAEQAVLVTDKAAAKATQALDKAAGAQAAAERAVERAESSLRGEGGQES